MSLSDCIKCWDTPCECGWEYRGATIDYLQKRADMFNAIIQFKVDNPKAKFSEGWGNKPETEGDKKLMQYLREDGF